MLAIHISSVQRATRIEPIRTRSAARVRQLSAHTTNKNVGDCVLKLFVALRANLRMRMRNVEERRVFIHSLAFALAGWLRATETTRTNVGTSMTDGLRLYTM